MPLMGISRRVASVAFTFTVAGCFAGGDPDGTARAVSAITLADCSEGSIRGAAPADAAPMLDRAFDWIHRAIPYCQCVSGAVGGYRTDCSGFVSMVWSLPAPGHTTYSFAGGPWDDHAAVRIGMAALVTGDALNYPGVPSAGTGHVVLFGGWLDDAHTRFCSLEESHTGTPARVIVRSVDPAYLPMRLATRQSCAAHCEGTVLVGSDCGRGDCGAFGSRCVQDALGARCAFAFCPDTGERDVCWNGSHVGHCSNGALTSQGDCATYGARCVADGAGARCVFAFCPPSGDTDVCWSDTHIGHCSNGALTSQGDCAAYASFCSTRTGVARCESVFCVANHDDVPVAHDGCWITGGDLLHCDAHGAPTRTACPAGQACSMVGGAHCEASRCPATGEQEICASATTIGHCFNGSVIDPRPCGANALCSTLSGTPPHCVSTVCVHDANEVPAQRPVCLADGRIAQCDGDGVLLPATSCPTGTRCVEATGGDVPGARCVPDVVDAGAAPDAPASADAGSGADVATITADAGVAPDGGASVEAGITGNTLVSGGCSTGRGGAKGSLAWVVAVALLGLRRRRCCGSNDAVMHGLR